MKNICMRTDLALEKRDFLTENNEKEIPGIESEEYFSGKIKVTSIRILTEEAGEQMEKRPGTYVTIETPEISDCDSGEAEECSGVLCEEIRKIYPVNSKTKTLVVGMGNHDVTPDALGPKTAEGVLVTRHHIMLMGRDDYEDVSEVSVITPGVMGTTGIETVDMVKGIVEKIKPDLVIAVDSLSSGSLNRVSTTIQMCDTGISPGAGVGNLRPGINENTLGVKVIAIGVPTVINSSSILYNLISEYGKMKESVKSKKNLIMEENVNDEENGKKKEEHTEISGGGIKESEKNVKYGENRKDGLNEPEGRGNNSDEEAKAEKYDPAGKPENARKSDNSREIENAGETDDSEVEISEDIQDRSEGKTVEEIFCGPDENRSVEKIIAEVFPESMIVTPGNIDEIITKFANIIAAGINLALHPGVTMEILDSYRRLS